MTGLVRKATFFTVGAMLVAASAMAGVPSPGYSSITTPNNTVDFPDGSGVYIVGSDGGGTPIPDPLGLVHINVRDLANNPINNCSVSVSLGGCVDMRIGDPLVIGTGGPDASATVFCPGNGPSVRRYTDVNGDVDFIVQGAGPNAGDVPGCGVAPNPLRAKIIAAGVTLANIIAASPDLDGANGVDANDLSLWLDDQGSLSGTPNYGRSDYDFDGTDGANDLSLWLDIQGGVTGATFASATNLCH